MSYLNDPEEDRKYTKPRGFYKARKEEEWTKDKTKIHLQGKPNRTFWPIMKLNLITVIFITVHKSLHLNYFWCFMICVAVTLCYQSIIAAIVPNTYVLPAMDHQCLISTDKIFLNYMNL